MATAQAAATRATADNVKCGHARVYSNAAAAAARVSARPVCERYNADARCNTRERRQLNRSRDDANARMHARTVSDAPEAGCGAR